MARLELRGPTSRWRPQLPSRGPIAALAVVRHRGCDDDPSNPIAPGDQLLEEDRGAHHVRVDVLRDLVHRLPDAHRGGVVEDRLDAVKGAAKTSRSCTSPTINSA